MKYTAFADVRERSTRATPAINRYTRTDHRQLPPKRPVQNRRKQGVEFGCRLGLQRVQLIDLGLQVVEVGDDAALFKVSSLVAETGTAVRCS